MSISITYIYHLVLVICDVVFGSSGDGVAAFGGDDGILLPVWGCVVAR